MWRKKSSIRGELTLTLMILLLKLFNTTMMSSESAGESVPSWLQRGTKQGSDHKSNNLRPVWRSGSAEHWLSLKMNKTFHHRGRTERILFTCKSCRFHQSGPSSASASRLRGWLWAESNPANNKHRRLKTCSYKNELHTILLLHFILPSLPWRWCPQSPAQMRFPEWTGGRVEADLNPRRNNALLIKDAPARILPLQYSPPANTGEQLQSCALAKILKLTGGFRKEGGHFFKLLSVKINKNWHKEFRGRWASLEKLDSMRKSKVWVWFETNKLKVSPFVSL